MSILKTIEYRNIDHPDFSRAEYSVLGDASNSPNEIIHVCRAEYSAVRFDEHYKDFR